MNEEVSKEEIKAEVREKIIRLMFLNEGFLVSTNFNINQTGKFVIGGPVGDWGLRVEK